MLSFVSVTKCNDNCKIQVMVRTGINRIKLFVVVAVVVVVVVVVVCWPQRRKKSCKNLRRINGLPSGTH